jgi:flagellin
MIIAHNLSAIKASNSLNKTNKKKNTTMEKLSTGLNINRASDDAAGLTISEGMRIQIMGLQQATSNSQDGITLVQTADGALGEIQSTLQRIRELAVQASNGTNNNEDREGIQSEVSQALKEIDSIRNTTEFNNRKLIDGSSSLAGAAVDNWYDGWQVQHITFGAIDGATGGAINANTLLYNVKNLNHDYLFPSNSQQTTITLDYNYSGVDKPQALSINCDNTTTVGDVLAKLSDENVSTSIINAYQDTGSFEVTLPLEVDETPSASWSMSVADTQTGNSVEPANTFFFNNGNIGTENVIEGNEHSPIILQIGATSKAADSMKIDINDMGTKALGIKGLSVATQVQANVTISKLDAAIDKVSSERAKLGSYQNRLTHIINNLGNAVQNTTAAESKITDADMAKEMMEYAKESVLCQATMAMLGQANDEPNNMMNLLKQ